MRTTFILPDDLYREVKRAAADADRTVTSLVEEALRAALTRRNDAMQASHTPYHVAPTGSGGLQPGVDLSDTAALLDAMEGR